MPLDSQHSTAGAAAGPVTVTLRDATANPAPLGLMGFGLTTVLLNIHNAGLYPMNTMILGMGIFYGGLAQVAAGRMEWKKNSTFGTTAFLSYGLFGLTLVGLIVLPKWTGVAEPDKIAMGWYLFLWGVFTGLSAVYAAVAQVWNELYRRQVLPLGPRNP